MGSERKDLEVSRTRERSPMRDSGGRPRTFTPRSDVIEREDAVVLILDLPGVEEKSLNIDLERDTLTISGQATAFTPEKHELMYRECWDGMYKRTFVLADVFAAEKVEAQLRDGVLTVTLPKLEKAKPRKIAVRAG